MANELITHASGMSGDGAYSRFVGMLRHLRDSVSQEIAAYASEQTRSQVAGMREFILRRRVELLDTTTVPGFLESAKRSENDVDYEPITHMTTVLGPLMATYGDDIAVIFPDVLNKQMVTVATDPTGVVDRTFDGAVLTANAVPGLALIRDTIQVV